MLVPLQWFTDGAVGLVYVHRDVPLLITTMAEAVPQPPFDVSVVMRQDFRYSVRDYAFWTQWYDYRAPHLAFVPRRRFFRLIGRSDFIDILFGDLPDSALEPAESMPDANNKSRICRAWLQRLSDGRRDFLGPCDRNDASAAPEASRGRLNQLRRYMSFALAALETSAAPDQLRRSYRDVQRWFLETMAMYGFAFRFYWDLSVSRTLRTLPVRGVFTQDALIASMLWDQHVPVFYARDVGTVTRKEVRIHRIVRCAQPFASRLHAQAMPGADTVSVPVDDLLAVLELFAHGSIVRLNDEPGATGGQMMEPLVPAIARRSQKRSLEPEAVDRSASGSSSADKRARVGAYSR
jgi:hypothetical protein